MVVWAVALAVLRLAVVLPEGCHTPRPAELRRSAEAAVGWFVANQRSDGRWMYVWRVGEGEVAAGYSIVRHAGVTMSLYQAVAAGIDADAALAAGDLGTRYALRHIVPTGDGSAFALRGQQVQTGASALLAAGLAIRRQALDDRRHDGVMRAMGRFLAGQVEASGAVAAYWDPATTAPVPGVYSKYYTGEAFWALGLLAEAFPEDGFGEAAAAAGRYLAIERDDAEGHFPAVPDHWAGYGLDQLARLPPGGPAPVGPDEIDYALRLAGILGAQVRGESQRRDGGWPQLVRGSFARAGGLGTLGEGLGGLWRLAGEADRLRGERAVIAERITCVGGLLVERQVGADEAGRLAAEADGDAAPDEVLGSWVARGETRMDDQQHALSAVLAAIEVVAEEDGGR